MMLLLGSVRTDIAGYLSAVIYVYTLLIFAFIILQLAFSLGVRMPYSRGFDVVFGFLRDVCDPYLRLFRRFIPMVGPLDFSPIVAILALQLVNSVLVKGILHG